MTEQEIRDDERAAIVEMLEHVRDGARERGMDTKWWEFRERNFYCHLAAITGAAAIAFGDEEHAQYRKGGK